MTAQLYPLLVREANNHNTEVIGGIALQGVVEQTFGSFLRIVDPANELDSGLIVTDIPQLDLRSASMRADMVCAHMPCGRGKVTG